MSTHAKPPTLIPGHTYIHITSPDPPSTIEQRAIPPDGLTISYVGQVGELKGEHIFEVKRSSGDIVARAELPEGVVDVIKGVEGVKGVKVLDVKQRAKRDEI